ncbi:unnamed protein product [Calypogeia fissa]
MFVLFRVALLLLQPSQAKLSGFKNSVRRFFLGTPTPTSVSAPIGWKYGVRSPPGASSNQDSSDAEKRMLR